MFAKPRAVAHQAEPADRSVVLMLVFEEWSSNPHRVYAEAIVDDFNKADTIIAAEEGTIELIHKDTVQIRWNHGSTTKFKRAVLTNDH